MINKMLYTLTNCYLLKATIHNVRIDILNRLPHDVLIEYGNNINIGLKGFENCMENLRQF